MINALELLKNGIYIAPTVPKSDILQLFQKLYPKSTDVSLLRIGGDTDGAYLVPNDLNGIAANYSPGTGSSVRFEMELFEQTGIKSHLADPTVQQPQNIECIESFVPKYIGPFSDQTHISLEDWIKKHYAEPEKLELMAQIDIEGAEYLSLFTIPLNLLRTFRILVIEFHDVYAWGHPYFKPLVESLFARLLTLYNVLHVHPNNNDEEVELVCGPCPRTIEITFHRKDRHKVIPRDPVLPHPLDILNNRTKPPVAIPKNWKTQSIDY
jgi:hypothetical protein